MSRWIVVSIKMNNFGGFLKRSNGRLEEPFQPGSEP
jgi:hypothetical protein